MRKCLILCVLSTVSVCPAIRLSFCPVSTMEIPQSVTSIVGHITQYRAFANGIFVGLLGDPVNIFQDLTRRHSQGKVIQLYVVKNCSHGIQDIIDAFHRNGKRR